MNVAFKHMLVCQEMLEREPLSAVLAYCAGEGIVPPVVSLYGASEAAAKLGDYGWWAKQLKMRNARSQRRSGHPHNNRVQRPEHPGVLTRIKDATD